MAGYVGVENHEAVQEGFEEISEQARQDGQSFNCSEDVAEDRHRVERTQAAYACRRI